MKKQVDILGVPVDMVSRSEAIEEIKKLIETPGLSSVFTPNPEMIMLAQEDEEFLSILKNADLVLPDGIGLLIASKIKGLGLTERVTGIDTMNSLLEYCGRESKTIYLLGGKPGVPDLACKNIENRFTGIKIGGFHDGYFTKDEESGIVNEINSINPDILFVCLGAPKQEKWISQYKHLLKCNLAMGVGGSVDIYAGTAKRAPKIFQKLGMEWFYRLAKEPWRYKRMMSLPRFILKILK
ncbi:WecB/TagA/CpsF family glycosyltransferase [Serpentinicella alkaliphila]|uniref:N-acetylglucosaminyldiphosphoundecaprenol N-acetyl-beta-D-mannosaminyltransferase n=1 Tax=Serpentinicella alkaliphila TaxID=1734049 RepID=A0A4R2TRZ3_9FIRM|nr:WecB/TagA/CpsF family glycosyltransferase [Serpentinicella alkaliphila]QUH25667.1 WecB/TagA/CpsF family glycosyltransferase [Serpentinicella alkaliphila]TCQ06620.1 N-acetylmannosaminyltransferase [Serpentinicella alkaliphila]